MTKSALPEGLTLTEKEFNRLMKFAGKNDLTIRGNSSTFVLTNSLDNWWAFLLLAQWRGEDLKKFTPEYLTLEDLNRAPIGAYATGERGERLYKSIFGWVLITREGQWASSAKTSEEIMTWLRPIRFEVIC